MIGYFGRLTMSQNYFLFLGFQLLFSWFKPELTGLGKFFFIFAQLKTVALGLVSWNFRSI